MDGLSVWKGVAERWNSLAREQKISAGILAFCGVIAMTLSVQRIQAGVNNPFTVSKTKYEQSKSVVETIAPEQRELEESKRRDTDGDGISDYDEEKVIGTSPYLRDTDGDGIPDNAELAQGTNPICPEGQACTGEPMDLTLITSSTRLFLTGGVTEGYTGDEMYAQFQMGLNEGKKQVKATGSTSTMLEPTLVRDPAEIRRVLRESGKITEADLAKITDEQLLKLYDEAMLEAAQRNEGKAVGADANATSTSTK